MAKKRNKQNQNNKQKAQEAQHRNDFYNRLSKYCKTLTGEDILSWIPTSDRDELLYKLRPRTITIEPEAGSVVSDRDLKYIKEFLTFWIKNRQIEIGKNKLEVHLKDDFNFGIPLYSLFDSSKKLNYKNSQKIRDLLEESYSGLEMILERFHNQFVNGVFAYMVAASNDFADYYLSYHFDFSNIIDSRLALKLKVRKYPIEKINVVLDNNNRPAFRIGWTFPDDTFEWMALTPSQLGLNATTSKEGLPVYIQKHALSRITERIDCIMLPDIQANIYFSLMKGNAIRNNGQLLFDYELFGVKVGYFKAVLHEGKVIIRTFLFLTCMGTPEGNRLQEMVGLQKLDAKFLQMDKLSTFMSAKISTNPDVRAIFEKANCLSLMELFEKLNYLVEKHPQSSPLENITRYVKVPVEEETEWMEEEK